MGTSFAVAHASGVAALLWSLHPDWSAGQVRAAMVKSARDLGPAGPDPEYGHGLLDAAAAVAITQIDAEALPDGEPVPAVQPALQLPATVTRDIAITAVQAPGKAPLGTALSMVVTVTNQSDQTEHVAVTLSDRATGVTLGPTLVDIAAGASLPISFETVAVGPIGEHAWVARATFAGGADGHPEDNEHTEVVTVEQGALGLTLKPGKPAYRRSERIHLSLQATDAKGPVARLRVRISLLNPEGQTVFRWTALTNTKGQALVSLPGSMLRVSEGLYRAEAEAEQSKSLPSGSYPPTTTFTTFEVVR
jgi:hypothetical protein